MAHTEPHASAPQSTSVTIGTLAPPQSPRWRFGATASRASARSAIGWLALAAIFALSMELTSRTVDWVRFRMPILSPVTSEEDLIVRDHAGMHGRPSVRYRQWSMDSLGLRGPEVTAEKPPGTVRIMTVGASETFGLYESPGKEYPKQLEDSLNAWLRMEERGGRRRAPRAFQVLNAAMPGMSLPTLEQDLRNRLVRLHPDIVVLYPTPAGYLNAKPPRATPPDTSSSTHDLPLRRIFYPRVLADLRAEVKQLAPRALLRWLRHRELSRTVDDHPAEWRFTTLPRARLTQLDADLRDFVAITHAAGAEPILATHANTFVGDSSDDKDRLEAWERFYPRATAAVIVAFDSAARLVTQRVAADSGVVAVDLAPALSRHPRDNFVDAIHFTDAGAAVVASQLAEAIENRDRAPQKSASSRDQGTVGPALQH